MKWLQHECDRRSVVSLTCPGCVEESLLSRVEELGIALREAASVLDTAAANAADQTSPVPRDPIAYAILCAARDRALATVNSRAPLSPSKER